jgi:thymidylate kinase
MTAVLITGCSAAGKTTLARVLAARGVAVLESDNDPVLTRWVDAAGAAIVDEPEAPDLDWLSRHFWAWDPARLDELIAAAPSTLYICGGAANELDLADRFSHMFLLEIDEPTMLARIDDPSRDNDWGRIGETREHLRRFLPGYQARLRAAGVTPVDATRPVEDVADAILAATLAGRAPA